MKKLISCLMIITLLASLVSLFSVGSFADDGAWDGTVGTGYDGGNGTVENPYLISTPEALAYLASYVNQSPSDKTACGDTYFKMTCDIDLNNKPWIPIGYDANGSLTSGVFFSGIFDGCGYAIKNLNASQYTGVDGSLNVANCAAGLFGWVAGGKIMNLGIESGIVSSTGGRIGGIAGQISNGAVISNCYNKATVKRATDATTYTFTGGIVGFCMNNAEGKIENCVNYGYVDGSAATAWNGNNMFGGIVGGYNSGALNNCYNVGKVSAGTCRGGGIVGRAYSATVNITNCYTSGIVEGTNAQCAYIIGIIDSTTPASVCENLHVYTKNQTVTKNAVGNDANGATTGKVTVNSTDELAVPVAEGESFLIATEAGKLRMTMVGEGTATVDGTFDDAYKTGSRIYDYGTGTNALTVGTWNDTVADIYTVADYQKLYMFIDITDGDVLDGDNAVIALSFDGGENIFTVTVDKKNTVTVNGIEAGAVTSAAVATSGGYAIEISVPVAVGNYNLLIESYLGLAVRLNDVDASGATAAFSATADGAVEQYRMGEIHGQSGVAVTGVTLDKTTVNLYVSESVLLKATLDPENAYERGMTWTSSDTSVASVDAVGLVTANKKGTATITVTTADGGRTATCTVTVSEKAVTGVTLDAESIEIKLGKKKILTCTVAPMDAQNKNVIWSSDNEKVATVSDGGLVTAVGGGEATITVKTEDGGFEAKCKVKVIVDVEGITVSETSKEIKVGESFELSAKALPEDATEALPALVWTSSDTSVATVDENGKVTAVGEGEAVISVASADGSMTGAESCTVKVSAADVADTKADGGEEKKGCSSAILSGGIALMAVTAMGAAFIGKKKEH
ncbi:MAG: Ig-like domain-containing protein [Clostridia bacterium]|nr:Ig-like domain-containing protein [Clostridia bacterium]